MPALPNDPFTPIPAPPATNPDLPGGEFPSMQRIEATDLVGPPAANRQHAAGERRALTIRDRINKIISFLNVLDDVMLRNDGAEPRDGVAGLRGDIPANGHTLTGLRAGAANGEPVRFEEFQALYDLIAGQATMPPGLVGAFPGAFAPAGWIVADGSLYTPDNITTAEGAVTSYPSGFSWGSLTGLRTYLGNTWGGDGILSFGVPDYRGRVVVGTGIGRVGGVLTSRSPGQYGGAEEHTLTPSEVPAHSHWMFGDNNYSATSWGVGVGAGDARNTSIRANSGVGGGDEKYHMNIANGADRLKTGAEGGSGSHNNMQPFSTALICLKL